MSWRRSVDATTDMTLVQILGELVPCRFFLSVSVDLMNPIKRQFDCSSKVEVEHVKVLVSCLVLDRCLVESAEGMNDALLVLDRRSVNP